MITIEDLSKLGGINDRDEMINACSAIPDEELRSALVLMALSWNNSIDINDKIFQKQTKEIARLEKKVEKLEKQIQKLKELEK